MPANHSGELYFNCQSQGVIHIISIRHGYMSTAIWDADHPCEITSGDHCAVDEGAEAIDNIRNACMGQVTCTSNVAPMDLSSTCRKKSNYALSVYECIESESI